MLDRLNDSQLQRLQARDYSRQAPQGQPESNAVALWNDIDTALGELLRLRVTCGSFQQQIRSLRADNESLRERAKKYREDVEQLLSEWGKSE